MGWIDPLGPGSSRYVSSSILSPICGAISLSREKDTSRDSWWLAILTNGEGYHNFHHMFSFRLPQRHSMVSVGPDQMADPWV